MVARRLRVLLVAAAAIAPHAPSPHPTPPRSAATSPAKRSVSGWVWPNTADKYLLLPETMEYWGGAGFLTELFVAAGHQVLPQSALIASAAGWPFSLPGDAATGMPWARAALDANVAQAKRWGMAIHPTVSGPLNVTDARAFLSNRSAIEQFTAAFLADALNSGYGGYNFDCALPSHHRHRSQR